VAAAFKPALEIAVDKENDAFRTISEVAEDLDVPKHVLRFWEVKFPQVRPMKRGGGRRYYRPEDLDLLRGIRHLLHAEGYTIKGVQKILREQGIDHVKRSWRERPATTGRKSGASSVRPTAAAAPIPAPVRELARRTPTPASAVDLKTRVDQIVVELETCRALLTGSPAPARRPRRAGAGE
jgi:DNA-binding transcriptional MerR regulator